MLPPPRSPECYLCNNHGMVTCSHCEHPVCYPHSSWVSVNGALLVPMYGETMEIICQVCLACETAGHHVDVNASVSPTPPPSPDSGGEEHKFEHHCYSFNISNSSMRRATQDLTDLYTERVDDSDQDDLDDVGLEDLLWL